MVPSSFIVKYRGCFFTVQKIFNFFFYLSINNLIIHYFSNMHSLSEIIYIIQYKKSSPVSHCVSNVVSAKSHVMYHVKIKKNSFSQNTYCDYTRKLYFIVNILWFLQHNFAGFFFSGNIYQMSKMLFIYIFHVKFTMYKIFVFEI